jgi:streptogramin lyase
MLDARAILNAKINVTKKVFSGISASMLRVTLVLTLALAGPLSVPLKTYASMGVTYYPIPQGLGLAGEMTIGPDGAIWYANPCPGDSCTGSPPFGISRMTLSGEVTRFATDDGGVGDITAGPDGALWFTEGGRYTAAIGRITTDGQVTQYYIQKAPIEPRDAAPQHITAGPDGALWFTYGSPGPPQVQSVGRISTAGDITFYPLPTTSYMGPYDITAGPDGALWFTETYGNSIGRITTDGNVTQYPLPSGDSGPYNNGATNITAGPDGALWFTEVVSNMIGRITTDGNITEYQVINNNEPTSITSGSDGNIWFYEATARKIVRFTISYGSMNEYDVSPNDGGTIISVPGGDIWFGRSIGTPPNTWTGYIGHFNPSTLFKPGAPTNLTAASPTSTAPVLSWAGGQDITSYNVYANGVLIGTTTSTTYTDNTSAEGNINYYITSVLNGLESDPSNTAVVVYDKTGPTVTYTLTPAANSSGWNHTNVTVNFTCSDALSGVNSCPSPVIVSGGGVNQQVVRTATDNIGNTSSITATINIDKTSPTIVKPRISDHVLLFAGSDTISATTSDGLSGIGGGEYFIGTDPGPGNGAPMSYTNGAISVIVNATATTTYSMRSKDLAGNWSGIVTIRVIVIF